MDEMIECVKRGARKGVGLCEIKAAVIDIHRRAPTRAEWAAAGYHQVDAEYCCGDAEAEVIDAGAAEYQAAEAYRYLDDFSASLDDAVQAEDLTDDEANEEYRRESVAADKLAERAVEADKQARRQRR